MLLICFLGCGKDRWQNSTASLESSKELILYRYCNRKHSQALCQVVQSRRLVDLSFFPETEECSLQMQVFAAKSFCVSSVATSWCQLLGALLHPSLFVFLIFRPPFHPKQEECLSTSLLQRWSWCHRNVLSQVLWHSPYDPPPPPPPHTKNSTNT